MSTTVGQLRALLWKEILVETRGRESLVAGVVFSLLVLVIFNFALDLQAIDVAPLAGGILWITFLFAGTLALGRSFARERDRRTLEGLLLSPVDRSLIYLAKVTALFLTMALVEIVSLPAFFALFNLSASFGLLAASLALGTLGLASVGTLFAAIAAHTRARDVLLPLLLFPVEVPALLASVKTTGAALIPPATDPADAVRWFGLLAAFDAIFLALSIILVEPTLDEN